MPVSDRSGGFPTALSNGSHPVLPGTAAVRASCQDHLNACATIRIRFHQPITELLVNVQRPHRLRSFSPNGRDVRCADFSVAADNGNAKEEARSRATMRSGMSGSSSRDTCCMALTTLPVNGASLKTCLGLSRAFPQIVEGGCRQTVFLFDEVDAFFQAYGGNLYCSAICGGVSVSDAGDHLEVFRKVVEHLAAVLVDLLSRWGGPVLRPHAISCFERT